MLHQAIVVVIGLLESGKTMLVNTLTGAQHDVGAGYVGTGRPNETMLTGEQGHCLTIMDLPGIDPTLPLEGKQLAELRRWMLAAQSIVWTVAAPSPFTRFDAQIYAQIIAEVDAVQRAALLARTTFVLTKVDQLSLPGMVFGYDYDRGSFIPSNEAETMSTLRAAELTGALRATIGATAADRVVVHHCSAPYRYHLGQLVELTQQHITAALPDFVFPAALTPRSCMSLEEARQLGDVPWIDLNAFAPGKP